MGKMYKIGEFPRDNWRWNNFTPEELMSKSDRMLMIDPPSLDKLQELRERLGVPINLTSAFRSPAHNKKVGGASGSMHLQAKAFDVKMAGMDKVQFVRMALNVGFTGFGFYLNRKNQFIHIDTGPSRMWGK